MSYTVLARKWRPQNFAELVGQEHVQRAIVNAIEQQRVHHAYLFTGTRGVGKTTIARIFSKCLNCETGITATPCGSCKTCQEIEQGRFVDLMEIDAASRTKVEDTREILDNVQYRPSRGRYKVYLIDEVHMLSNSSFNALLKTLEEPPPHVIFLLATTDPQKLPVTVLSRCLQFHLKRMTVERINKHLAEILTKETIEFDDVSLNAIAKAADGSMRDALSLLDQAIAFGGGKLSATDVIEMLGSVDHHFVRDIVIALSENEPKKLLNIVDAMAEFSPNYAQVLSDILSKLHQLAVANLIGSTDDEETNQLLERLSAEDIQLFYQVGIHAKKDLPLAPEPREGFEMALLRMLAFRPQTQSNAALQQKKNNGLAHQVSSHQEPDKNRPAAKQTDSTQMLHCLEAETSSARNVTNGTLDCRSAESDIDESKKSESNNIGSSAVEEANPPFSMPYRENESVESTGLETQAAQRHQSELQNNGEISSQAKQQDSNAHELKQSSPDSHEVKEPVSGYDDDSHSRDSFFDESPTANAQTDDAGLSNKELTNNELMNNEIGESENKGSGFSPTEDLQIQMSSRTDTESENTDKAEASGLAHTSPEDFSQADVIEADARINLDKPDFQQLNNPEMWYTAVSQLGITGAFFQVLNNSRVDSINEDTLNLTTELSVEHFVSDQAKDKIVSTLSDYFGEKVRVNYQFEENLSDTPKLIAEQKLIQRLETVRQSYIENPKVANILATFNAHISEQDIVLNEQ